MNSRVLVGAMIMASVMVPWEKVPDAIQGIVQAEPVQAEVALNDVLAVVAKRLPYIDEITDSNRLLRYWSITVEQAFQGSDIAGIQDRVDSIWPAVEKQLDIGEKSKRLTDADRQAAADVFRSFITATPE